MAMLVGRNHLFELVNPAYLQVVDHREVLGLTVAQALPDAVAQGYLELLDRVYETGEPYAATGAKYAVQVEKDGPVRERFVDFVFQPIRDASSGIFVEGVDVTERIAAVNARQASEARPGLVIEGAKDHAILASDAIGRVTDWSAGAEAIFGWLASEIVGHPVDVLFTPEDRASGVPAKELLTAAREGCANDERWHLRKDGSRVYMNGTVRPLPAGQGRPAGFLKIARDATSEHRGRAMRDALIQLHEKFRDVERPEDITFEAVQLLGKVLDVSRVGYGTIDVQSDTLHVDRDWTAPGVAAWPATRPFDTMGPSSKASSVTNSSALRMFGKTHAPARQPPRWKGAAPARSSMCRWLRTGGWLPFCLSTMPPFGNGLLTNSISCARLQ